MRTSISAFGTLPVTPDRKTFAVTVSPSVMPSRFSPFLSVLTMTDIVMLASVGIRMLE